MTNNKERYFAFAHAGAGFVLEHCVTLKVEKAMGTTLSNGMHLTHLQLCKNNGKRSTAAGKLVEQYNGMVGDTSKHIHVVKFPACDTDGVLSLKRETMLSHPIVSCIIADLEKKVVAAWSWSVATLVRKEPVEPKSKKTRRASGGGEKTVNVKLVVDQKNVLDILHELGCSKEHISGDKLVSVACEITDKLIKKYGSSVRFSKENREYVISCVRDLFVTELMFVCAPLGKAKHSRIDVIRSMAADIVPELVGESEKLTLADGTKKENEANSATIAFFRTYVSEHGTTEGSWKLEAKEFVNFLNNNTFGTYRLICVESFLAALINADVVARSGVKRPCRSFVVDNAKLVEFLTQHGKK